MSATIRGGLGFLLSSSRNETPFFKALVLLFVFMLSPFSGERRLGLILLCRATGSGCYYVGSGVVNGTALLAPKRDLICPSGLNPPTLLMGIGLMLIVSSPAAALSPNFEIGSRGDASRLSSGDCYELQVLSFVTLIYL